MPDPSAVLDLGCLDLAGVLARRELTTRELVEAVLARIAATDETLQAWVTVDADGALAEARGCDDDAAAGRVARPAPRRADRGQGRHRCRRDADDDGRGGVRPSPAAGRRGGGRPAARGGRGDRRQDRRHPVRVQGPGADHEPVVGRAHPWRVVLRLRGGRGRAPGPGGDRDADRGLDPAAVGVLRGGRPQGGARRRADGRRLSARPDARPRGPDRAVRGRRRGAAVGARRHAEPAVDRGTSQARDRARAVRARRAGDAGAPRWRGRRPRGRWGADRRGGAAGLLRAAAARPGG